MRPMWQHQIEGMTRALQSRDFALFFEQGCGKTRTLIEAVRRVYAVEQRMMRTLILCPQIVCENWQTEWKMFSKIDPFNVVVLRGSGKKRAHDFLKAIGDNQDRAKIFITNFEAVQMKDLYALIHKWKPEVLVCDESQRLKSPTGTRAKLVAALADNTKHNYILTGTPILQSPMDAFMQFRILDRGETFGKNHWAFKSKYFMDKNAGMPAHVHFPKWIPRSDKYPELRDKIASKSMRVLKSECLDLPPLVRQNVYVEMSSEQAKMYNEMKRDFVTWIKSKKDEPRAVVAQLAVTKALRLQQIVSGFARDEKGDDHHITDNPRLAALGELLGDLTPEHKVIVWASFKENYKMIAGLCEKMGLEYRMIHGDIGAKEKQVNMQDFREDPKVRVMIANQAAGGTGVNLVEASYMIYFSKNFSLEQDLQSEARSYRAGSEMHSKVTRIDLVCKGSIDELVFEALANKQAIGEQLLDVKSFD